MTRLWPALPLAALGNALPSVAAIEVVRTRAFPALGGRGESGHVALTFDDGPDPNTTPRLLDELARLDIRATFFLLGSPLAAHPELGRRIVAEGHEAAVHGWTHRVQLLRGPLDIAGDLARAHAYVGAVTGTWPRHWRPSHGVLTTAGLVAGRRLGMRAVLWNVDGREWRASATASRVADRVTAMVHGGATVLLHGSDMTAPPGTAAIAMAALPSLVECCVRRGWALGPLGEHGLV